MAPAERKYRLCQVRHNRHHCRQRSSPSPWGYLSVLPGINFSPQFVRYAFSTYGERDLGFRKSEAKIILDHLEGTEPDDVTGKFYSSDPAIRRKREMITLWAGWLVECCAKAIAADPLLSEPRHRRRYTRKNLFVYL